VTLTLSLGLGQAVVIGLAIWLIQVDGSHLGGS
jgi:hypothetical protein